MKGHQAREFAHGHSSQSSASVASMEVVANFYPDPPKMLPFLKNTAVMIVMEVSRVIRSLAHTHPKRHPDIAFHTSMTSLGYIPL